MKIHREFVDVLIAERSEVFSHLIKASLRPDRTFEERLQQFDQVLFTLDTLRSLRLLKVQEREDGLVFDHRLFGEKLEKKTGEWVAQFIDLQEKIKARKSWWIEIEPGLLHYRANGYKTDETVHETRKFWIAAALTLVTTLVGILAGWWLQKK